MEDNSDYSGLDKSLWARFDEAKKALRTVRCCNKLNWGAPDANEVRWQTWGGDIEGILTSLVATRWPRRCSLVTTKQPRVLPT